jgi:serine/threonine protein kinase/tetratricopeptide (TPR) repeat protein
MAVVYKARDVRHNRDVAVKVLKPSTAAQVDAERFLREIQISAKLTHPLIVGLIDSGRTLDDPPLPFYVMPLLDGESLSARIRRDGALPVQDALRIARELGEALAYAHDAGVVHRDVKPDNVMLCQGHALVTDFGIAQAAGVGSDGRLTETGISLGTPAYMSPEQATGERTVDPAADQYSLACVVFAMLTGEPPFKAETSAGLIARHVMDAPPPLPVVRRGIPESVASAVARALSKDPQARFPNVRAFMTALDSGETGVTDDDRSLVVLPFTNLSPDAENEFFSDGLTEEIITDLSTIRAIRVISRTSAMRYKGTTKDLRSIGAELGVRHALTGSVRRAGTSLRIAAQLIDVRTDAPLWAQKFSGSTDDVFEVQERIAREIVNALDVTLTSSEDRRLAERPIRDPRAFDLYLRARQSMVRFDSASVAASIRWLREADALEPNNAEILGQIGVATLLPLWLGISTDESLRDQSLAMAERILALDPGSAAGNYLMGVVAVERGEMPQAVVHLTATLAREPHHPEALLWCVVATFYCDRTDAALARAERWVATDPLQAYAWMGLGCTHWFSGRAAASIEPLTRAVELEPNGLFPRWQLGYAHALVGNLEAATRELTTLQTVDARSPYTLQLDALVRALRGDLAGARSTLADVRNDRLDGHISFHLGESYAMAGEIDAALDRLQRGAEMGFCPRKFYEEYCPFLAPVRGHPRFAAVLSEVKRRCDAFTG